MPANDLETTTVRTDSLKLAAGLALGALGLYVARDAIKGRSGDLRSIPAPRPGGPIKTDLKVPTIDKDITRQR